jgi:hypothetical protein
VDHWITAALLEVALKLTAGHKRNSQIYQLNGSWVPELTETSIEDPLVLPDADALADLSDPDSRRFSLALSLVMLHVGARLISDNYFCRSTTIRFAESGAC